MTLAATISAVSHAAIADDAIVHAGVSFYGAFSATFDDPYGMANNAPMLTVTAARAAAITVGNSLTVNGVSYTVRAKQPDNYGLSVLLLERT